MGNLFKIIGYVLLLNAFLIGGCATTREQDVENDLNDFRAWVRTQASSVANRTEKDWERARRDFKRRTAELDRKQEHFSDELKQDYQHLKDEFRNLDESSKTGSTTNWERTLLGSYADIRTINQDNVRDAYVIFLDNVREQHKSWTNADWEQAKKVMEKLNNRKEKVADNLPTDDEVKIKALQMEFIALETANDVSGN